ncbi:MAG: NAD(P)H-dependent oxidoreductase subunit E [Bacteroidetes bacterium]|nr:NAD(P)H-dependent oxidoreductase subunit E [Bacteroidota bacterium]
MNKEERNIIKSDCNCSKTEINEIKSVVDEVISITGGEKEKVILILQEVQKRLNYVPSDALKYICEVSEITPGQISGVSTFYSQFRHLPVGRHTIKICTGTACHVKGSQLITESFQRELGIDDTHNMSEDSLFSIEEVACLGCCTLAPVIQIDGKTYGHVKPNMTGEIIKDFLSTHQGDKAVNEENNDQDTDAEVRIGLGSCCVAGGSRDILSNLIDTKESYNLKIRLKPVGCVGVCNQTPLLEIVTKDNINHRYTNVKKEQVEEILLKHIKPASFNKRLLHRLNDLADTFVSDEKSLSPVNLSKDVREKYLNNFLNLQLHLATMNSGIISPESFEEYRMLGGFNALEKTVAGIAPVEVINIVNNSGLRGRGGAGFPTGKKWKIFSEADGNPKYVVCNGDEGDPGAFMDRMLLESFPYRIIEGMLIAGFATGAQEGIFYIRAEYPLAVLRIRTALENCYKNRMLGQDSKYADFRFNITVFEGAGAFVCGEETALIASIEGKRGYPHFRPPYPVEKGYNGKPTLVNNVETLSLIPWILNNGSDSFSSIGTEKSKGTKVFALAGKVSKGGLIEVPMGTTIREIVENIGNGVGDGRSFKSVQIGGPSGGCIPASLSDTPVDFEQLTKLGAMMGSGGMVVLDDSDCMVDIAKYFLSFTHKQSCGKCTFCRVGTKQMLNILTLLSEGKASMADIDELERLSHDVKNGSLCGLGKTAPNPVLTGLQYFREEYEAHTRKICPAKKCRELIGYVITDNCTGCTKCYQECPVGAIEFKPYEKHKIDNAKCTKCDNCRIVCPENAVEIVNINEDKN